MLLNRTDSVLLIIDAQERLAPAIDRSDEVVARLRLLALAATQLAVPVLLSEQYPKGLGATLPLIREAAAGGLGPFAKVEFSCARVPEIVGGLAAAGRMQLVLCGFETHICVLQSAIGLAGLGYHVFVAADAAGSRTPDRHLAGLARMRAAGIEIVDSEMAIFEWLERAGSDEFRAVQKLVK